MGATPTGEHILFLRQIATGQLLYWGYAAKIDSIAPEIYKYLNFDKMDEYVESARRYQRNGCH
jgi:aconitase B